MELKLTTDLSTLPKAVECNAEELKSELIPKLTYYKTLVVTEDTIRAAKDDRAALNKLRTALDNRRKEVKAACLAPYEAFERQCKEILTLIDEPILAIDTQLRAFAQQEQDAKYARLASHFQSCMTGIGIPVTLDKILNPKWANKSMKEDTLRQEISAKICEIQECVKELQYTYGDTPHITAVLKCYYAGFDRAAAHLYGAELLHAEQAAQMPAVLQRPPEPAPEPPAIPADEKLYTSTFKATGTREQLRAARDYMLQTGIRLESV